MIDINAPKYKSHTFVEEDFGWLIGAKSAICVRCKYVIYKFRDYKYNYNWHDSIPEIMDYANKKDVYLSCDENIIKNIIE